MISWVTLSHGRGQDPHVLHILNMFQDADQQLHCDMCILLPEL